MSEGRSAVAVTRVASALEKKMNEMSQLGWDLGHVTTVAAEGSSAIYLI